MARRRDADKLDLVGEGRGSIRRGYLRGISAIHAREEAVQGGKCSGS